MTVCALSKFPDRDPVAVSSPLEFDGPITALWPDASLTGAVAVIKEKTSAKIQVGMRRIALPFLAVISLAWVAPRRDPPALWRNLARRHAIGAHALEMPDALNSGRLLGYGARAIAGRRHARRSRCRWAARSPLWPSPGRAIRPPVTGNSRCVTELSFTTAVPPPLQRSRRFSARFIPIGPFVPSRVPLRADTLTIDTETSTPSLLAELALPRNLILTRNANGIPVGTGPFRVADFQPGKLLKLAANEDSWSGRPFLDAIEIEFGKSLRDQAVATRTRPRRCHRSCSPSRERIPACPNVVSPLAGRTNGARFYVATRRRRMFACARRSLFPSIASPSSPCLLKGAAEPTASILPNWMTGYSAAFSTQPNLQRAKSMLVESRQPSLTLSYDPRDPQAQLIAERIALNAREAGITVQVSLSGADDIRLVRIALPSPDPALSLREMAHQLSFASTGVAWQYSRRSLPGRARAPGWRYVDPALSICPWRSAAGGRVRGWAPDQLGGWNLPDLWLEDSR